MTVTIHKKEYKMEMEGTVGITMIADRFMGDEPKFTQAKIRTGKDGKDETVSREVPTKRYELALLYAVFISSNREVRDEIMFYDFMLALSHKGYAELSLWFWKRWNEIEGTFAPEDKPGDTDDSKKKDLMRRNSMSFVSDMVEWIRRIFARN